MTCQRVGRFINVEYTASKEKEITILRISGKVDLDSHATMVRLLQKLKEEKVEKLILNLAGVQIISSSCIGAILHFYKDMQSVGNVMVLSEISEVTSRVFELLQLHDSFVRFADNQKAIEYINNQTIQGA